MDSKTIVSEMTLEEKCQLLVGVDTWNTLKIDRLGLPRLTVADGPHGLRKVASATSPMERNVHKAVCFPPAVTVAASFDPDLASAMGKAIGDECRMHDVHVLLGPGINIKRNPLCGRNFEYYSEDPHLTAEMAKAFISGLKSASVGACLKHFALNSQETYRMQSSSIADERSKHEIYYKAFAEAVKADPDMVMCSYNKVDDIYASENRILLDETLRKEFGFKKVIVSDWGAVNDRTKALFASLDLEMPANPDSVNLLLSDVKKGHLSLEYLDASVTRIVDLALERSANKPLQVALDDHHQLATAIAGESMVLLKNDAGILPLKKKDKLALIGALAKNVRYQGGGSSHINAYKVESVIETFPIDADFTYQPGYLLYGDGYDATLIEEAVNLAKQKDKVILVLGLTDEYESEGYDRTHLDLPIGHQRLVEEIAKVNPNVVVVLQIGSPVAMPWLGNVKAVLNAYLGGEGAAQAITDILFGKTNPSGRLAETFPLTIGDVPSTRRFAKGNNQVYYQESIYIGYRYFSTAKKGVLFPFGFGLSYTNFAYADLTLSPSSLTTPITVAVTVKVKNVGSVTGKEVVQLYVKNPQDKLFRAERELRRFRKVALKPGEEKTCSFILNDGDFAHYDIPKHHFVVNSGIYEIQVCRNANEVILTQPLSIASTDEGSENDPCLQASSYERKHNLLMSDHDFASLVGLPLDGEHRQRQRPFGLNDSIRDLSQTAIGRILKNQILKRAQKELQNQSPAEKRLFEEMIVSIPLRNIVLFSGGKIKMHVMAALVALSNRRPLRAIAILLRRRYM